MDKLYDSFKLKTFQCTLKTRWKIDGFHDSFKPKLEQLVNSPNKIFIEAIWRHCICVGQFWLVFNLETS